MENFIYDYNIINHEGVIMYQRSGLSEGELASEVKYHKRGWARNEMPDGHDFAIINKYNWC